MGTLKAQGSKITGRLASIVFWVALWVALAAIVGNDILLAGPVATLAALWSMLCTQDFWLSVASSSARIVGSACAFAVVGILLGLLAARIKAVEILLEVPIQVMKSAPVACVVVVLLVAFGASGAIVAIVAFVALPPFYVASLEASRAGGGDGKRVLGLMGLSGVRLFLVSTWPAILPLYELAAKTAIALSWRAGITGELLSIPMGSMGSAIYVSKLTLDTPALLAWTIVVMILALVCEVIVVRLLGLTARAPRLALWLQRRHASAALGNAPDADVRLCAQSVTKSYGGHTVLDELSLALGSGERVCLMAPTGTGKTTLLRIMLGLEQPDGGAVGHPALCGVALQQPLLVEQLSAWENVDLVVSGRRADARSALVELLPPGAADKSAAKLSGGTRRLVEIARAVFSRGEVIVLDEPFAGLDFDTRARACAFISCHLDGRPLVVATHERADATLLDARVICL